MIDGIPEPDSPTLLANFNSNMELFRRVRHESLKRRMSDGWSTMLDESDEEGQQTVRPEAAELAKARTVKQVDPDALCEAGLEDEIMSEGFVGGVTQRTLDEEDDELYSRHKATKAKSKAREGEAVEVVGQSAVDNDSFRMDTGDDDMGGISYGGDD